MVAAVVNPHPDGTSAFHQRLVLINVATGKVTTVATGFLTGWGGPTFSPAPPYQLAYDISVKVGANSQVWSAAIDSTGVEKGVQLTHGAQSEYPVWGPQGILYSSVAKSGRSELELFSGGHSSKLMALNGWPVAVSKDGKRLAAEGAACGVIWPISVNLSTRKTVKLANGFAPFGISPSGGSMLIAGSKPGAECGGPRSRIEIVPFGGGKAKMIAYGVDPSWADSPAVGVQG
jgi:hypothetical protein